MVGGMLCKSDKPSIIIIINPCTAKKYLFPRLFPDLRVALFPSVPHTVPGKGAGGGVGFTFTKLLEENGGAR